MGRVQNHPKYKVEDRTEGTKMLEGGLIEGPKTVRVPARNETSHSALQRTERSSSFHVAFQHSFVTCAKRWLGMRVGERQWRRNAERFKRMTRLHGWFNRPGWF